MYNLTKICVFPTEVCHFRSAKLIQLLWKIKFIMSLCRYVTIQIPGANEILTLCEVKVYSDPN